MQVLLYCSDYPPGVSGVGSYVRNMARALMASGHKPVIVTTRVPGMPEVVESPLEGIVYRCYDHAEGRSAKTTDKVLAIARENRIDVIEGADHLGDCAPLLARKARPPVAIRCHGSSALSSVSYANVLHSWQYATIALAKCRGWKRWQAESESLRRADVLSAPSRWIRDAVLREGVAPGKSIGLLEYPNPPLAPRPLVWEGRPTILFCGRIAIAKGIQYLPGILRRVRAAVPDVMLEIAGSDEYARGIGSVQRWLERQLAEFDGNVRYHGAVSPDAISDILGRAWVLVLPSKWDNFPVVVQESMVTGTPVVTSPWGGMSEMLAETTCSVADPTSPAFADAVIALLRDANLRASVGASARAKAVKAYAPDIIVRKFEKLVVGMGG